MIFFDFLFDHARLAVTFSGNTGPDTPSRANKLCDLTRRVDHDVGHAGLAVRSPSARMAKPLFIALAGA